VVPAFIITEQKDLNNDFFSEFDVIHVFFHHLWGHCLTSLQI